MSTLFRVSDSMHKEFTVLGDARKDARCKRRQYGKEDLIEVGRLAIRRVIVRKEVESDG